MINSATGFDLLILKKNYLTAIISIIDKIID